MIVSLEQPHLVHRLVVLALVSLTLVACTSPVTEEPALPRKEAVASAPVGCVLPAFPTVACTGVPAGVVLSDLPLNFDGFAYRVTVDGTVLDGVHVPGSLIINADDVRITNSQIDDQVYDEAVNGRRFSFSISDSTVGPANDCFTSPAIGEDHYTATRVSVRGHDDGFRFSGSDVTVTDSYVKLCATTISHSDGVQDYIGGPRLVFDHNTVDGSRETTSRAVFINSRETSIVTVTNNLLSGGAYVLGVTWSSGPNLEVHHNHVVNNSWGGNDGQWQLAADTNATCDHINWSGNDIVTIDADHHITSVVRPIPCPE